MEVDVCYIKGDTDLELLADGEWHLAAKYEGTKEEVTERIGGLENGFGADWEGDIGDIYLLCGSLGAGYEGENLDILYDFKALDREVAEPQRAGWFSRYEIPDHTDPKTNEVFAGGLMHVAVTQPDAEEDHYVMKIFLREVKE